MKRLLLTITAASFIFSCELRPELPETGSIPDATLPLADFSFLPSAENFKVVSFTNLSIESTNYVWDFGTAGVVCEMVDGELVCGTATTTTDVDPEFVRFDAGEGSYMVKLTALDANQASHTAEIMIELVDEFVPLPVTILNGDFEDSNNGWKISFSNGWDNNAFESSSDGSNTLYDGTDNGSKTRGAKWTMTRSAGEFANPGTRHALQNIIVSPSDEVRTVKYILEFEYAIKTDPASDPVGGRRVYAEILDGHFADDEGFEAFTQSDSGTPLTTAVGTEVKGKGVFTTVQQEFTTNASGEVAIFLWAITPVDAYIDNVKVYPSN